jgi:8-oxo-dGTP diphosphatase
MQDNPTPEQRADRILRGFNAELHDGNPMWLHANIKMEIQDAVAKITPKLDQKPRHAVGVSVLLVENGRLLLGRRKGNTAAGMLSTPGGRLELEEQPIYCAVREFYEETGARIYSDDLKVINVKKLSRFNDHYIMFYALVKRHDGIIQNMEPDKCEGWQWYTGYELTGRADITEPVDILQALPLIYTPSVTDQAKIDGWNNAIDMLEVTGHLQPEDAKMFRKP